MNYLKKKNEIVALHWNKSLYSLVIVRRDRISVIFQTNIRFETWIICSHCCHKPSEQKILEFHRASRLFSENTDSVTGCGRQNVSLQMFAEKRNLVRRSANGQRHGGVTLLWSHRITWMRCCQISCRSGSQHQTTWDQCLWFFRGYIFFSLLLLLSLLLGKETENYRSANTTPWIPLLRKKGASLHKINVVTG